MDETTVKTFQINSYKRDDRVVLICEPKIAILLEEAKMDGIEGDSIVLDESGARVTRDNVLERLSEKILMILNSKDKNSVWKTPSIPVISTTSAEPVAEETSMTSIDLTNALTEEIIIISNDLSLVQSLIPWDKLKDYDESIFKSLENGESYESFNRVGSTSPVARLSNFILFNLEKKYTRITAEVMRRVANEAGEKYPKSLKRVLPSGAYVSSAVNLYCVLENRKKTTTRAPKRPVSITAAVGTSLPLHKRKRFTELAEMSPNSLPEPTTTDEEAEEMILWLKSIFNESEETKLEKKDEILIKMKQLYPQICYVLATEKNVQTIVEKFPFLFTQESFAQHYEKLTNMKIETIVDTFDLKSQAIIQHFKEQQLTKTGKPKRTALDEILSKEVNDVTGLELLTKHFKEDLQFIVQNVQDVGATVQTIMQQVISEFPVVITTVDGDGNTNYMSFVGKKIINNFKSLSAALAFTYALFPILNLEFPTKSSWTWEMIQRLFASYENDSGILRGKKKIHTD